MTQQTPSTPTTPTPTPETVHAAPRPGEGVTACCGRPLFELPSLERVTNFPQLVTCRKLDDQLELGLDEPETPVRPYIQDGSPSSGYARGSTSSEAAEPARASSQGQVLDLLRQSGSQGLTGHEANDAIGKPRQTTGQVALSVLHGAGLAARLEERRDAQAVYVAAENVNGRRTEERGRHGRSSCPHCGGEL